MVISASIILIALVGFFGACIGSFLSVCIYRIPRDESIVRPRSHCPSCGKLIPWYCNIPVFSWLVLRGRCANCHARISPRYLILELMTALLFLMVFLQFVSYVVAVGDMPPPDPFAVGPIVLGLAPLPSFLLVPVYWLVLWGLILGTFVDLEHYILPDRVTIGGMVAGVVCSVLVPELHLTTSRLLALSRSGIGLLVGFGILWLIAIIGEKAFKKEAMGFGDVKLMGAIGAFFGWEAVLFVLFASSLFGSLAGLALMALGKRDLQGRIPFGPFLALGTLVWMFWGNTIVTAYMRVLFPPMG